ALCQPISQRRRQQHPLAPVARDEVLTHPRIVLNTPDDTRKADSLGQIGVRQAETSSGVFSAEAKPTPVRRLDRLVWMLPLREHPDFSAKRREVAETLRDDLGVFLVIPPDVRAWASDYRLQPRAVVLSADPDSPPVARRHEVNPAWRGKAGKRRWFPGG
ncbi:MAG: hypothetical protein ACXVXL_29220, partial [Solirubrobacteraceae bacterium]